LGLVVFLATLGVGAERPASAAVLFTNAHLKGRWVTHMGPANSFGGSVHGNAAGVSSAARQHVVRIGYIDWDGLGVASGRSLALTDTSLGQSMLIDFTWTGTYAVTTSGTGTLSVTSIDTATCAPDPPPEGGTCASYVGVETFGFAIGKRYGDVSLVQQPTAAGAKVFLVGTAIRQSRGTTPATFNLGHLRRRWRLASEPATSFVAIAPGDPGGVATAARQDVARVGYVDWTGLGGASGRIVATSDDNSGQTVIINFAWSGIYTMGSDGIGTLSITPAVTDADCTPAQAPGVCATFEAPQTYGFAFSKTRQRLFTVQTDTSTSARIFQHGDMELQ
jgi:hypothetical protein